MSVTSCGTGSWNSQGDTLVGFAERSNQRIMNAFFVGKRRYMKWAWKSRNRKSKSEIDFILSANPGIVQDVEALGEVKTAHRSVRSRIRLDMKTKR